LDSAVLREKSLGLIEKLHLLDGKYLKRAAVLLFHPDPEQFVAGAFVKIGYFRSNVDLLYHDEIHGDLFTQVRSTMDLLLTKYLKASISYRGIQRVESLPVPEAALREAVLNAILHKDYSPATPVQISVYADKLIRLEYRGICCFKNPLISLPASRLLHRQRVGLVVSDVGLCKRRRG
jgi:ATP-dependent DNA helicase RecG